MGIKIYGAGTAYPSIAPELTPLVCSGLHVAQSEFSVFIDHCIVCASSIYDF